MLQQLRLCVCVYIRRSTAAAVPHWVSVYLFFLTASHAGLFFVIFVCVCVFAHLCMASFFSLHSSLTLLIRRSQKLFWTVMAVCVCTCGICLLCLFFFPYSCMCCVFLCVCARTCVVLLNWPPECSWERQPARVHHCARAHTHTRKKTNIQPDTYDKYTKCCAKWNSLRSNQSSDYAINTEINHVSELRNWINNSCFSTSLISRANWFIG